MNNARKGSLIFVLLVIPAAMWLGVPFLGALAIGFVAAIIRQGFIAIAKGISGEIVMPVDEEPHGGHGGHHGGGGGHAKAPLVTVRISYWKKDPRVYILVPLAVLALILVEFLVWGILRWADALHFWGPGTVIGIAAFGAGAFIAGGLKEIGKGGKNVRAIARFFGRYLAIDFKSGVHWGLFPSLFTVHEYPLVSPEKPREKSYGEYQLPEDGAEIVIKASLQYALAEGWRALAMVHLYGGVEAVAALGERRIGSGLERLTADPTQKPHNYREAISAESLPRFKAAILDAPSTIYGVRPVVVELVVSGTPEFEKAAAGKGLEKLSNERLETAMQGFRKRIATIQGIPEDQVVITKEQALAIATTLPLVGGDVDIAIARGLGGDVDKGIFHQERKEGRGSKGGRR